MERTMKNNENKFQKYHAVWMFLRKCLRCHPCAGNVQPNVVSEEPPAPGLSPLDRITEHLHRLGLGQQVHVRYEATGGDFILEDADGLVHAKDYDEAVTRIERIWLYRR